MADVHVAADVAVLRGFGVVIPGILVGMLKPFIGLGNPYAVLQGHCDGLAVQIGEGGGIMDATVQEGLSFRILIVQEGMQVFLGMQRIGRGEGIRRLRPVHLLQRLVEQGVADEARSGSNPVLVGKTGLLR